MGNNRVHVCKIRGYGLGLYAGLASLIKCSASQPKIFTKDPTSWFHRQKEKKRVGGGGKVKKLFYLVTLLIALSKICHHLLENNFLFLFLKNT